MQGLIQHCRTIRWFTVSCVWGRGLFLSPFCFIWFWPLTMNKIKLCPKRFGRCKHAEGLRHVLLNEKHWRSAAAFREAQSNLYSQSSCIAGDAMQTCWEHPSLSYSVLLWLYLNETADGDLLHNMINTLIHCLSRSGLHYVQTKLILHIIKHQIVLSEIEMATRH